MTVERDDIVWAFDGGDGRSDGLAAMLRIYVESLQALLPQESDDPFEQIVADLADDPTERMREDQRLSRLFPPAMADTKGSEEFWRDSIHSQARGRIAAARVVAQDLVAWEGLVPVTLRRADEWARVLGALRLYWYSEVAGPDRLAEPDPELVEAGGVYELIEWLGYLIEDLMESRQMCLKLATSLDPEEFYPADRD